MADRQTVLILDYGSQYTQLIARRIRECHVYCEIHPGTISLAAIRAMTWDAAFVPVLVKLVTDADPAVAKAARESLISLPGPAADSAILAMLESGDGSQRLTTISLASQRGVHAA